jgi:4-hydroxy-3-polyprenylbenzoate decarboxylase
LPSPRGISVDSRRQAAGESIPPGEPYPVFHVTAITHRKDAIYPATIVGMPPMEDFYISGASVKLFLPIFKMNFPEIVDIEVPAEGVFHNLVFVSIRKTYPMQAYKIMHGLWGMGQMMFTKGPSDVLDHATSEIAPPREIQRGTGDQGKSRQDYLTGQGSKLGIDATKKIPGEGFKRPWPPLIKMDKQVKDKITALFGNAT